MINNASDIIQAILHIDSTEQGYACIAWNQCWEKMALADNCTAEKWIHSVFFKSIYSQLPDIFASVLNSGDSYTCILNQALPTSSYSLHISRGRSDEVWLSLQVLQNELHADILQEFFAWNLDLLSIADFEGRFVRLNTSWQSLLGYTDNELLQSNFFDFIHPEDIEPTRKVMSALAEMQPVLNFVNRYRTKQGDYKHLEWSAVARGNLIFAAARDISHSVSAVSALKESERLYQGIISVLPDIIFRFDSKGVFLYCHSGSADDLIMKPELFIGKNVRSVLPEDLATKVLAGIQKALDSQVLVHFEYQIMVQDKAHWYEARMMPSGSDEVVCIIRDIHDGKHAMLQLEETGNILKRTSEMSRVGAWEVDMLNDKVYWSEVTKAIHEVPDDYIPDLQSAIHFFKQDKNKTDLQLLVDKAIQEGTSYDAELILKTQSGKEMWVRVWGMPEFENGVCKRFYGTIQDIDKFKRTELELENTRQRLELLLTSIDDVVYSASVPDFKLMYMNSAVFNMYGYTQEEMYENNDIWKQVIHTDDHHVIPYIYAQLNEKGSVDIEYRIITRDQKVKWVRNRSKFSLISADGNKRLEGIITDVTNSKLSAIALDEARQLAEKASKAKSDFVARMSHEIRTPLNGIIGFTDMLKHTQLTPDQSKYLDYASTSAHNLLDIVNDVLDFSKIEAGMIVLDMQYISIQDLMEECLRMFQLATQNKHLKFTLKMESEFPDYIYTDPIRFKQILNNLISNAIKFTEKGEIILGYALVEKNTEGCLHRIYVQDTGIGISEAAQQNIFKAFVQADVSTTRKYGGTGLGLVISQQLVEQMGGKMYLESKPNVGSTFSFELFSPCKNNLDIKSETETPERSVLASLQDHRLDILLVDDMPMNRFLLSEMILSLMPLAQIHNAEDATEALEILERLKPDLIFMDIQMPGINGYEATIKLRASENPSIRNIPVYAVTAGVMEDEIQACKQAGMTGVVTKPLNSNQILEVLQECIPPHL